MVTRTHTRTGAAIDIRNVTQAFRNGDNDLPVLDDVSLSVQPGEFIALVGPSGSGKSTLIRLLAGLDRPLFGAVQVDGSAVTGPDPSRALVFQDPTLLPWRTVRGNVAIGPQARRAHAGSKARIEDALALVGLTEFADAWPAQLSGGMAQRAALARALVNDPSVLLLDEPLGKLDALTRRVLQGELLRLWQERGFTAVLITHDVSEALTLADRLVVLSPRPARIREVVEVGLDRPRDQSAPEFVSLRARILALLDEEATTPPDELQENRLTRPLTRPGKSGPMSIRTMSSAVAAAVAAAVLVLALAAPAAAHVTVSSSSSKGGGSAVLTFTVPDESEAAHTVALTVHLPTTAPFTSVLSAPVPGWTARLTRTALPAPLKDDDGNAVTSAVTEVTWTATAGGLAPGEFGQFSLSVGPLPDRGTLYLPAVQRYSDGSEVNWVQQAQGGAEPEHPAPSVVITPDPASLTASAGSGSGPGNGSGSGDGWGIGLGAAGIVLALSAGAVGGAALTRARRTTVSPQPVDSDTGLSDTGLSDAGLTRTPS
ncbi:DUF1775 domain-containing protein [Streptacidiphilus sp. PAMC 29251]